MKRILIIVLLLSGTIRSAAQHLKLETVPRIVYKNEDGSKRNTESWFFRLVVADSTYRESAEPVEAVAQLFRDTTLLETVVYTKDRLRQSMTSRYYSVNPKTHDYDLVNAYQRSELFDVNFEFTGKPIASAIDRVHITLTVLLQKTRKETLRYDIPLANYVQKTELTLPFKGPGIVSQGQMSNGGHSGHSNQFALDLLALTDLYAPINMNKDTNSAYSSWGKELIAPAGGKIVYSRNDVPDNPDGSDPETVYLKCHDPLNAHAGNAVVIDHENGEYSVLMHMKLGSVKVTTGQRVSQGDSIGSIGSSGDSFQPHIHFQLQTGPVLFRDPSVPVKFKNVSGALVRGRYFESR